MIILSIITELQSFFGFLNETQGVLVFGYLTFLTITIFIASITITTIVESIANIFIKKENISDEEEL